MSTTKIYNGYQLPALTFLELNALVKTLQPKMKAVSDQLLLKVLVTEVSRLLDRQTLGQDLDKDRPLLYTYKNIRERIETIRRDRTRDPAVDFEATAVFFPLDDKILVRFYSEQTALEEVWLTAPNLKTYNTGCSDSDGLSSLEWEDRVNTWDKAMSHSIIPSQNGFSFTFTSPEPMFPPVEKILAAFPSLYERSLVLAQDSVLHEQIKKLSQDQEINSHNIMEFYFKARDYLNSSEGKAEVSEKVAEIMPKLISEPTRQDLVGH